MLVNNFETDMVQLRVLTERLSAFDMTTDSINFHLLLQAAMIRKIMLWQGF